MKIGENGEIRIPDELREQYDLTPGTELEIAPRESGILIRSRSGYQRPVDRVRGILEKTAGTDALMEAIRGR